VVVVLQLQEWVGLLIGIQVLLWLLSGLVMSLLDPAKVSGQQWAHHAEHEPQIFPQGLLLEPDQLSAEQLNGAISMQLQMIRGQATYRIRRAEGVTLVNATDGSVILFDKRAAERLARQDFTGEGEMGSIESGVAPDRETRNRIGPYWRVNFSDNAHTSLYISATTGDMFDRRNSYWRVFDFFWMLHIMDYAGRQNFNNTLIIVVALIAIWLGLSGFILLFGSFKRKDFNFLKLLRKRSEVLVTLIDPLVSTPQQVRLQQGGNLFLSLAANNVTLPSNCGGGGSCGLCLVQMESSELEEPNAAERDHIPAHLLQQGFRLACQHEVAHSITLRLAEGTIASKGITATVRETRYVTPFIKEILLECDQSLNYAAGSYFQVRIPAHEIVLKPPEIPSEYQRDWDSVRYSPQSSSSAPLRRAYSAANYPGEFGNRLLLNVRFQPPPAGRAEIPTGTGSAWVHSLTVGDTVELSGPYGHFHAQDTAREMVFIGGGAGMGPLRSIILDQLLNKNSSRTISFWYGARNRRELFYQEVFDQLALDHDNFSWTAALSGQESDEKWQGPRGMIHRLALESYLAGHPKIGDCEFYICGPPAMLMATLEMLAELGVQPSAIRYDDFGN
jgi:Na(+)-translocating NADH:ubiquinone oxidoreductase F subunit